MMVRSKAAMALAMLAMVKGAGLTREGLRKMDAVDGVRTQIGSTAGSVP